ITEKFSPQTILQMCQMQLPTKADINQQMMAMQQQANVQAGQMLRLTQMPQAQQMAEQNPQMAQQAVGMAQKMQQSLQENLTKLKAKPTVEDVMAFLRNNRARSFVLDIETDSTIQPDENAEKQRRAEFMGMLSSLLPQLSA